MKYLLLIFLATIINFAWAQEGVDIADPVQVSELSKLQGEIESISTAIMECITAGEDHVACLCTHKEEIVQFNSSVKNLFANHPDFENHDLVNFTTPDGVSVAQSLKGILEQASIEPVCP